MPLSLLNIFSGEADLGADTFENGQGLRKALDAGDLQRAEAYIKAGLLRHLPPAAQQKVFQRIEEIRRINQIVAPGLIEKRGYQDPLVQALGRGELPPGAAQPPVTSSTAYFPAEKFLPAVGTTGKKLSSPEQIATEAALSGDYGPATAIGKAKQLMSGKLPPPEEPITAGPGEQGEFAYEEMLRKAKEAQENRRLSLREQKQALAAQKQPRKGKVPLEDKPFPAIVAYFRGKAARSGEALASDKTARLKAVAFLQQKQRLTRAPLSDIETYLLEIHGLEDTPENRKQVRKEALELKFAKKKPVSVEKRLQQFLAIPSHTKSYRFLPIPPHTKSYRYLWRK